MSMYNEENLKNIASAIIEYRNRKSKVWKKELKEDYENGVIKDENLQQLKRYFIFPNVIKAISNKTTVEQTIKLLEKNIA